MEGNKVEVLWRVKNTGDKTMHFQIGAHPAFLYPNYEVDQPDRGYFAFDVKKDLVYRALVEKGASVNAAAKEIAAVTPYKKAISIRHCCEWV